MCAAVVQPGDVLVLRRSRGELRGQDGRVASYAVNPAGVEWARHLIDGGQYVLDSDWGKIQPQAGTRTNS